MAARISASDFDGKVLSSIRPVIVEFYSDTCVACKKLSPILADAEDRYSDRVDIYKVNTGYDTDIADRYGVRANPTLIAFKNGEVTGRIVGAVNKEELDGFLEGLSTR